MKHLNYLLLGAAGLMLASCSQEDMSVISSNENGTALVVFDLCMPAMQTRSYSDGTTAQQLEYAVYQVNDDGSITLLPDHLHATQSGAANGAETINLKKQVSFKLVTNRTYGFVFWASNSNSPYTTSFTQNGAVMNVDYTNPVLANNENLDAFYAFEKLEVKENVQMETKLYRPVAQINVGANDLLDAKKSNYTPVTSHINISDVYQTLNLVTGDVENKQDAVEFSYNNLPENEVFPVDGYDYITMAYALVPKDKQTVTVSFDTKSASDEVAAKRNITNVPVQRNHRTNLYGQLYTSNVDLFVEIVPIYDEPDYPEAGSVTELKMMAQMGGDILLTEDITLGENEYVRFPQGGSLDMNGKSITGSEDGLLYVTGGGLLIQGNGSITVNGTTDQSIAVWAEGGDVTIMDGHYESDIPGALIYVGASGGTINIKGGYFKVNGNSADDCKYTLNCYDAAYKAGIANIVVTGGYFYNYDPSQSNSENPQANFVAKGYTVVKTTIDGDDNWYAVVPEGVEVVAFSLDDAAAAAKEGKYVLLSEDINEAGKKENGYGGSNVGGITVKGGTLDGNGNTLFITNDSQQGNTTWTSVINTQGGTIKNITIDSDLTISKGLLAWSMTQDLFVDNLTIPEGTKLLYGINIDSANGHNVYFSNSQLAGWCSWGTGVPYMEFKNCQFKIGMGGSAQGYNKLYDGLVKPYNTTLFENCDFDEKIYIDLSSFKSVSNNTLTFKNCTVNGVKLTEENHKQLVTGWQYDNSLSDWEDYENCTGRIFFE